MRIGIDARWIFEELSGIGAYTRELIAHLLRVDHQNEYVLIFRDAALRERTCREIGLEEAGQVRTCLLPAGLFSIRNQVLAPGFLRKLNLDVYHAPNYMIPLRAFSPGRRGGARCVINLHDVIPLLFREYAPRSRKNRLFPLYRWIMRQVGRRADLIVTGSRSARADILRSLQIPADRADKVLVIPDGVAARFSPAPRGAGDGRDAPRTVLWVGWPDPYKNLLGLIEAFARLKKEFRAPIRLRLVGAPDVRYPEPRERAVALGIAADVDWVGYVSDARLVEEYRRADVFVLPSFYEGFGLPVIEAMACGIPVVCSHKGSLSEVAGDAAIQVAPTDHIGISEAIRRLLVDGRLAEAMREKGLRRAASFTWEHTARLTLEAYGRLMGRV